MKLVTIICEAVLEEQIVHLLASCGAHGHTAFTVRGCGSQGTRAADIAETGNVQIEVIVKPATAETLLTRLHAELFKDFAMVAYTNDIAVLRPDKF